MIGLFVLKQRPTNTQELLDQLRSIQAAPPAAPGGEAPPPVVEPPPAVAPPGDLVTRYGRPPQDVSEAIKRHWQQAQWVHAAEVSFLESGWSNTAENNTLNRGPCGTRYWYSDAVGWAQTEDSVGIFQINICAHGGTREQWHDPDANAAKGAALFASVGWTPWRISAGRLGLL